MTNKELLNFIKSSKGHWTFETESGKKVSKEQVIQALEQQPCEDCISRQKMLDGLASIAKAKAKSDAQKALMGRVMFFTEQLPSVKPKYTDEEIDRAQAVEQAYVDKMVELAVEETKRPKGKWIEIEIDAGEFIYKCTKCGMRVINPYKYCPNCGSYNGGEEGGNSN